MRGAIAAVLIGGALAGCQLVFDVDASDVTGRIIYRTATTVDGAIEVIDTPATDAGMTVRFGDDEAGVVVDADGNFRFARRAENYALEVALGLDQAELLENADSISLIAMRAGRIAEPVVSPIQILLPAVSAGVRKLATVGQWSNQDAPRSPFDWPATETSGGMPLGLLDGGQHDALYLLEYDDAAYAPGQSAISRAARAEVVMTDGVNVDLTGLQVQPVSANNCVTLAFDLGADIGRLAQAAPAFSTPTGAWAVTAVPSESTSSAGAINIVNGSLPLSGGQLQAPHHDPFDDHATFGVVTVLTDRVVSLGADSLTVFAGFTILVPAPHGSCPNVVAIDSQDVALGVDVALDGKVLATDDEIVEVTRPGNLEVTWTAEGRADFYDLVLFEVVDGVELERRRAYRTRAPRAIIDDDLLLRDHRYILRIGTVLGTPNTGTGDYGTLQYPFVNANTMSTTFIAR